MMRDDEVWGQGISGGSWEGGPRLGMEFLGWGGKCLTGFSGRGKRLYHEGHEGHEGKLTREGHTGDAEVEPQPHRYPTQPHRTRLCEPPPCSLRLRWALERHAVEPRRHSGTLLWLREKLCDERTGR